MTEGTDNGDARGDVPEEKHEAKESERETTTIMISRKREVELRGFGDSDGSVGGELDANG
jgi:hypothetical protein